MAKARVAVVRPRVRAADGVAGRLLEEEIRSLLEQGKKGVIALLGPAGSGKSTALAHMAAVLEPCPVLLDEPIGQHLLLLATNSATGLLVYARREPWPGPHLAKFHLLSWDADDAIEYLLSRHREQCAFVMRRIKDTDRTLLGGIPELWSAALEELAADPSLPDAQAALYHHLEKRLERPDVVAWGGSACLVNLTRAAQAGTPVPEPPPLWNFPPPAHRLLHYRAVQIVLAAAHIAGTLRDRTCRALIPRWPLDLLTAIVHAIGGDPEPLRYVQELLARPLDDQAMAASLVLALNPWWIPKPRSLETLERA